MSSHMSSGNTSPPLLQFAPWTVLVDVSFWFELARRKLEVWKLSEEPVPIWASYNSSASGSQRSGGVLNVGLEALGGGLGAESRLFATRGQLLLLNTLEAWSGADRGALLAQAGERLRAAVQIDDADALLAPLLLLVHADLKRHVFRHLSALPALPVPACLLHPPRHPFQPQSQPQPQSPLPPIAHLQQALGAARTTRRPPAWVAVPGATDTDQWRLLELAEARRVLAGSEATQVPLLVLADACSMPEHPGWPARNLLHWAWRRLNARRVRLLLLREGPGRSLERSLELAVSLAEEVSGDEEAAVGWERGPHTTELAGLMDPRRLAATALDLNLQLMRWRAVPTLPLERVAVARCLLVGAGTLGCNVARQLLAWGVRHITLVDHGRVAYSNPARQSLFEFDDAVQARPKAACAAGHLQRIFPDVRSEGLDLRVPMPGHVQARVEVEAATVQLEQLVAGHDAVLLLTDSREARWLPALLAARHRRVAITAALGFDSFVVLRHGLPGQQPRLGCYFCNDVTAPGDSQRDRTLDQQCTVARPGASMLASALAAEMLVALLSDPRGALVPPLLDDTSDAPPSDAGDSDTGPLGGVPHQVRGWLGSWRQARLTGLAFSSCVACGDAVQRAYESRGPALVADLCAPNGPQLLEQVAGLQALATAPPLDLFLPDDDDE